MVSQKIIERFTSFQHTSFGGIPCAQYFVDFYLWEVLLNENPQLIQIIELGTWRGGFTHYLYAQARARGIGFISYDSIDHWQENKRYETPPGYVKMDIFAEAESIGEFIASGDCALFCDNGNKPREIKTFAPYLTNNSIVLVHDWNDEISYADIPDSLEEIYGDFCDEIGSASRVFKKKQ